MTFDVLKGFSFLCCCMMSVCDVTITTFIWLLLILEASGQSPHPASSYWTFINNIINEKIEYVYAVMLCAIYCDVSQPKLSIV